MIFSLVKRTRIFYGWFALAGAILSVFALIGTFLLSFGVFLPVLSDEFGWSRAAVALALSLASGSMGLSSPFFGVLIARFGPRFSLVCGNLVVAFGIAALFTIQELWQLYVFSIIIGLGAGLSGFIASTTIATNWFVKKRSLALGIYTACSGLGGFIFPPIIAALISAVDWRITWLVLSGFMVILGVVLPFILVRDRPEDLELHPDGVTTGAVMQDSLPESAHAALDLKYEAELRDILRSRVLWLTAGFIMSFSLLVGTMNTHQVAYLQDIGFSPIVAATTVSVVAVSISAGGIALGVLALRLNVKYLAIAALTGHLIALIILLTTKELVLIYFYAILLGLGNGALITIMAIIVALYYHGRRYSKAIGIMLPFHVCTQSIAGFAAGAVYDAAQTYRPVFLVLVAFTILAIVFISILRVPKRTIQ